MHSFNIIVRTLFQEGKGSFISGILNDYLALAQLTGLDNMQGASASKQSDLVQILERNVLGGRIKAVKSNTGVPYFIFEEFSTCLQLPLPRASSMVSELAPVILFPQNLVDPKDVMIIEEPDSHLHPAAQAEVARMLVRMAKSGIRFIVTTHSDWLLDCMTNIVGLARLSSDQESNVSISPNHLGVWLFQSPEDEMGTVVTRIGYDEESSTLPWAMETLRLPCTTNGPTHCVYGASVPQTPVVAPRGASLACRG